MKAWPLLLAACAGQPGADVDPIDTAPLEPLWDPPPVCIHELMASNDVSYPVGDATPDWIELHNPGDNAVDLTGWTVSDNPDDPAKHSLTDLTVEPGGHLVLLADGDPDAQGGIHLPFRLSSEGESVVLTAPDGRQDLITYEQPLPSDFALARAQPCCPGIGCWSLVYGGTPGAP